MPCYQILCKPIRIVKYNIYIVFIQSCTPLKMKKILAIRHYLSPACLVIYTFVQRTNPRESITSNVKAQCLIHMHPHFPLFFIEILTLLQILFEYRKNEIRHVMLLPSLYHIILYSKPSASAGILCKISNITISIKAVIQVKHKIQLSMSIILLCNLIYVHPQFRWFIVFYILCIHMS